MTEQDRAAFFIKFLDTHSLPLLKTKGAEYSRGDIDVNSNFRRVALDLGVEPTFVCWVYLRKHLDSIANYVKNPATSLTESIESRIGDAINYLLILASLIQERTN